MISAAGSRGVRAVLRAAPTPRDAGDEGLAVADDRSAALLLRVWIEEGRGQFRARMMAVGPDGQESERTIALASAPDEVLDAVRGWLEEFLRHAPATE